MLFKKLTSENKIINKTQPYSNLLLLFLKQMQGLNRHTTYKIKGWDYYYLLFFVTKEKKNNKKWNIKKLYRPMFANI